MLILNVKLLSLFEFDVIWAFLVESYLTVVVGVTKYRYRDINFESKLDTVNLAYYGIAGVSLFTLKETTYTILPLVISSAVIELSCDLFLNCNTELVETLA